MADRVVNYTLAYHPRFKQWFNDPRAGLTDDDRQEIRILLEAIRRHPEKGATIRCLPGALYQKSQTLDRARWPHGIRVFYTVVQAQVKIAIIDAGDHAHHALGPNYTGSIYWDESEIAPVTRQEWSAA